MTTRSQDDRPDSYRIDDPEELARNIAKAAGRVASVFSSVTRPETMREIEAHYGDSVAEALRTFGRLAEAWIRDPARIVEAQSVLWARQFELWQATIRRALGEASEPVARPEPGDRRFAHDEWQTNPAFDFLKQAYLISSAWAENLVEETENLDEQTRRKARFYVRQLANALAPTNFAMTNPQVLRETLTTNGRNLVKGMENLAADVERGGGSLRVRQTDLDAFKVGENLAITPGKVVLQTELFQLIQYQPTTEQVFATPLLIIPPWINKFYILDLTPEKSFIKWAVDQGHTVFVVSWVNPDERLSGKTFEDYMREGVLAALDAVLAATRRERANVIGYCVGGTLLAATLAWMSAVGDERIASATFFAAQVDFSDPGDLKVFVDEEQLEAIERKIEREGYLAGSSMAHVFNLLRSNDLIWSYVVSNYLLGRDPFPFDLLYWNSDSTRMPAANHLYYLNECYLKNSLAKGEMAFSGRLLDVGKVKIPVYSLATRDDHIAPAVSVFRGVRLFGGPARYVVAGSGHIAGVINPPWNHKYQYWSDGSGDTFEEWLASAHETKGSWWPDWQRWVEPLAGNKVKARKPASRGRFKAIEDAPGSYVTVRSD